ncbi:MAG: hypothetical protein ACOVOO_03350 [Flavobacteriales bacterium]|jgi:hypothetical protein
MPNKYLTALISFLIVSCGPSDLEKHKEEYKECIENKKEEKDYKYANIQEALNAYDFEVARDYLACHPSRDCYNTSGGYKTSCSEYSGDESPYEEDLTLIVTAEITYFIGEGEFKKAESAAKEADLMEIYNKIAGKGFEEKLDEMIEKQEFKKIHSFLSDIRFEYQKTTYWLESSPSRSSEYINKAREFNALLDKVLSKFSYAEVEVKNIKQVVDLALPELEEKIVRGSSESKLVDTYKKEATAKYLSGK